MATVQVCILLVLSGDEDVGETVDFINACLAYRKTHPQEAAQLLSLLRNEGVPPDRQSEAKQLPSEASVPQSAPGDSQPPPSSTMLRSQPSPEAEGEHGRGDVPEGAKATEQEKPPPVSKEVLDKWMEGRGKQAPVSAPPPKTVAEQLDFLKTFFDLLGPPPKPGVAHPDYELIDQLDHLEAAANKLSDGKGRLRNRFYMRALLSMLVTRTRWFKDLVQIRDFGNGKERIKKFILNFPAYARLENPGYVNGLQIGHVPEGATWLEDAHQRWHDFDELISEERAALAEAKLEKIPLDPPSKPPRSKAAPDEEEEGSEGVSSVIDPKWPLWSKVRGKSVVILGGELREPARQKLQEMFEMAELEWLPADNPRRLDSLVERINLEKVDLVLVLQNWIAHKVSNKAIKACKKAAVPWALVGGYGAKAVKAGLDRFLGGEQGGQ